MPYPKNDHTHFYEIAPGQKRSIRRNFALKANTDNIVSLLLLKLRSTSSTKYCFILSKSDTLTNVSCLWWQPHQGSGYTYDIIYCRHMAWDRWLHTKTLLSFFFFGWIHYKKLVLHQHFFPSAFQNRRNRSTYTYSSAFRNR